MVWAKDSDFQIYSVFELQLKEKSFVSWYEIH